MCPNILECHYSNSENLFHIGKLQPSIHIYTPFLRIACLPWCILSPFFLRGDKINLTLHTVTVRQHNLVKTFLFARQTRRRTPFWLLNTLRGVSLRDCSTQKTLSTSTSKENAKQKCRFAYAAWMRTWGGLRWEEDPWWNINKQCLQIAGKVIVGSDIKETLTNFAWNTQCDRCRVEQHWSLTTHAFRCVTADDITTTSSEKQDHMD